MVNERYSAGFSPLKSLIEKEFESDVDFATSA
jgi:hypothetical protein